MARKRRVQSDEVWYHLMNRGAAKRPVFESDGDRLRFLALLEKANTRHDFQIHAYCLMGNHYHLMGYTPRANIAAVMHLVDGSYTQYFNKSRERDGPLFRGRYHAVTVANPGHWMQLSRYIHRNPVEAGWVTRAEAYRWSSYRAYLGLAPCPGWLTTDYVLGTISTTASAADYRAYVEEAEWQPFPHCPDVPDPNVSLGA